MWALRYGSILNLPRKLLCRIHIFKELFKCSLCLGFWSGVAVATFSYLAVCPNNKLFMIPFASSALCWFFDSLLDLIIECTSNLDNSD